MRGASVLTACEALIDFHAWDHTKLDPRGWLSNFDQSDMQLAMVLLGRFTFYSDQLVDQLFRAAFQSLSNVPNNPWKPFDVARANWVDFCSRAIVTIVQGEQPNPSDSGWFFARKARQILGFDEGQLLTPADALNAVLSGHKGAVIFVDDFVGSGEQFVRTWRRQFTTLHHGQATFASAALANPAARFFYCNAMTTMLGRQRISGEAPLVEVSTGNIIPFDYSLTSPNSALWPTSIRADGIAMVERISKSLGYLDSGGDEYDWQGFHQLGLGLAFEHSVPDASLPIFYSERNGWKPLVRRL
jgi:hypothetical protein